ncbi:MAG TPA: hypothetical protein VK506_00435 [Conexibacter sp.]|nr:hypothetical protein [Conexibacter sp.]
MRLNVFGPVTLVDDAGTTSSPKCSVRAGLLLSSLAMAQSPVARTVLLERLWPARDGRIPTARSDSNLDGYATEARHLIGAAAQALHANKAERSLALRRPGQVSTAATLDTDVREFQMLRNSSNPADLEQALSLVRGPLLAGVDGGPFPWLGEARQRFAEDCARVISRLHRWPSSRATAVVAEFMAEPSATLLAAVQDQQESAADAVGTGSIEDALAARYMRHAPSLRTLAKLVVPISPPYYNTVVTLGLSDTASADTYQLTYHLEFTAQIDEFVIALTTRASLTDLLLAECPDIGDSFTCSSEAGRAAFARQLMTDSAPPVQVWCLESTPSGATRRRRVALKLLRPAQAAPLLRNLDPAASADVVLLRGTLPGRRGATRRIAHSVRDPLMDISEHYAFWIADRPMYIDRIKVDAAEFSPGVHLHPMLGNIANEWEWDGQRCDVAVENWVVKNQGIFLTW